MRPVRVPATIVLVHDREPRPIRYRLQFGSNLIVGESDVDRKPVPGLDLQQPPEASGPCPIGP